MRLSKILIAPVISEKTSKDKDKNYYTFLVDPQARKHQIKEDVERVFGVSVKSVRTAALRGKPKRRGKRLQAVRTQDRKKAIVRLAEKDKIGLFETEKKKKK